MHSTEQINIVFASDNQYLEPLGVCLTSLLLTNDNFIVTIIATESSYAYTDNYQKINETFSGTCIQLNWVYFDDINLAKFKGNAHITKTTYVRLFLSQLLSEDIKKILYIDCDTIISGKLKELYQTDMSELVIAAVPEHSTKRNSYLGMSKDSIYFNAGILLINLELWRKENLTQKLIDLNEKTKIFLHFVDQDLLNIYFDGRFYKLDQKNNFRIDSWKINKVKPIIIHYVGSDKPWQKWYGLNFYFNEYIEILQISKWKRNFIDHIISIYWFRPLAILLYKMTMLKKRYFKKPINIK